MKARCMLDIRAIPPLAWVALAILALLGAVWFMRSRAPAPIPLDAEYEEYAAESDDGEDYEIDQTEEDQEEEINVSASPGDEFGDDDDEYEPL